MSSQLCAEPYVGHKTGMGLTCLKPEGHDGSHTACLGFHPHVDEEGRENGDGEYEWVEWSGEEGVEFRMRRHAI